MSYSILALLTRNLQEVFGETTPSTGAQPSTNSTPKTAYSTTPPREPIVAVTRSIASPVRSGLLTQTFDISQLPRPRNREMVGGSNGYQAALARRQLTLGLISSLPGMAGLPPFISFSTSYPELYPAARRLIPKAGNGGRLGSAITS